MSQTSREPQRTRPEGDDSLTPRGEPARTPSRAWQNWIFFAATIMALMGLSWAFLGLVALVDEEFFPLRAEELLVLDSYSSWGWVHMIGGVVSVVAAVGILWGGHPAARILGMLIAGVSAVVNLCFLPATPVWSTVMVAFDVLVIHALAVHGWEIDERR